VQWPETLCPHRQRVYSAARRGRAIALGFIRSGFSSVTPAKAGVQGNQRALAILDPGFRRDDEQENEPNLPNAIALCGAGSGRDVEASSGGAGLTTVPAGLNLRKLTPPAEEK
jgi:hypothetical protein